MWQKFSEGARRVVFVAQEEAGKRGEREVGAEHLLLALLRDPDRTVVLLLGNLGLVADDLRAQLIKVLRTPEGNESPDGDWQLSAEGKRVIDLAYDEVHHSGNGLIGTEHLLLGLVLQPETAAGRILVEAGMDPERVRAALKKMPRGPEPVRKSGLDKLRDALKSIAGTEAVSALTLAAMEQGVQQREGKDTPPVPHTGDRGILRDAAGTDASAEAAKQHRSRIEVAADADALSALAAVFAARDEYGYRDLHARGGFFLVPTGTRAKILLPPQRDDAPAGWRMRLLDGEHEGRAGWVRAADFERTDHDDDPFPPDLPSEA